MKVISDKIYCPLLKREIETGYCWELCNIATDEILLHGDVIKDWNEAQRICEEECGILIDICFCRRRLKFWRVRKMMCRTTSKARTIMRSK